MDTARRLTALLDYRGFLYSVVGHGCPGIDLARFRRELAGHGIELVLRRFPDIDFRSESFAGEYVIYQSSEDTGLHYKSYIEDVLLGLQLQGAVLIPRIECFRAHHNKSFMEILRDLSAARAIKGIRSRTYGTLEDFRTAIAATVGDFPVVIKDAEGAGSRGVTLARTPAEAVAVAARLSRVRPTPEERIKEFAAVHRVPGFVGRSFHRRKFVVQNLVAGLDRDFKVLIFDRKAYVLSRRARRGDFRASGSGLFEFVAEPLPGLLEYADHVYQAFDVPFISLDIGHDGTAFSLIEFQFVRFGTKTIEHAAWCFVRDPAGWRRIDEPGVLEREYAASLAAYVDRLERRLAPR